MLLIHYRVRVTCIVDIPWIAVSTLQNWKALVPDRIVSLAALNFGITDWVTLPVQTHLAKQLRSVLPASRCLWQSKTAPAIVLSFALAICIKSEYWTIYLYHHRQCFIQCNPSPFYRPYWQIPDMSRIALCSSGRTQTRRLFRPVFMPC